mmetsp:Transcript_18571/g.48428  ORF Transcript_18571/g.48428 Transcript_18571/m.48428 type:complete len:256 (-) Transcript_18571:138-905(-)
MYDASSEHAKQMAPAISYGSAARRKKELASTARIASPPPASPPFQSSSLKCVRTNPGATQLTRMPSGPSSCAKSLVSPISAVFDTPYSPSGGAGLYPAVDDINTKEACGLRWGLTSLTNSQYDLTLVSNSFSNISDGTSRVAWVAGPGWIPTQSTQASILPWRSTACLISRARSSALAWWHATPDTSYPRATRGATAASTPSCFRDDSTSLAPSSANRIAAAYARPLVAAVITTTLPSKRRERWSAGPRSAGLSG